MRKGIRRWLVRLHEEGEKGQSIIILAFAVVMLLAFVGIAIDVGRLYGTRIQLSRAVDAAALAGVLELPELDDADARARQFMRTNGYDPDNLTVWLVEAAGSVAIGKSNYMTVTAQLPMDTMFLRFVGWETVEVPALAVAEFKSPVEVYASQHSESGVAGVVNLNVYGQDGNAVYGDAFSPKYTSVLQGTSCGCAPSSRCPNPWRPLLRGREGREGVYPFRIHIPADYETENGTSIVEVEILDPDDCNDPANSVVVTHLDVNGGGTEVMSADGTNRTLTAMADTGDAQNPKWFVRMDKNHSFCYGWDSYESDDVVETQYTLYYYKQDDLAAYEIAQYTIKDTLCGGSTDLEWVIPGETHGTTTTGPDTFSFNLNDYLDVETDEGGNRSFYLDVEGTSGTGSNGFDLWAGRPPTVTLATNVNDRNVFLLNAINEGNNYHSSGGVGIWAIGFLPLNVNTNTTYTITLGYIPPKAAGTNIRVSNFDLDRNTDLLGPGPTGCDCRNDPQAACLGEYLQYRLEGVPSFFREGDVSCSSRFGEDVFQIPHEFYGGYLYAVFQTSQNDTTDWMLEYLNVMDETFVRLVK